MDKRRFANKAAGTAVAVAWAFAAFAGKLEIRLDYPVEGSVVSLLTERQKSYLSMPLEARVAGFDDPKTRAELATIGWQPAPVTFVWSGVEWADTPATLEKITGTPFSQLDKEYVEYIRSIVQPEDAEAGVE